MSIISRKNFIQDEDEEQNIKPYTLPTLVTTKPEVISIEKAFAISTLLHPASVLLIWLIVFALTLLGIKFDMFGKTKIKQKQDIEFVLVDKPATPKNPNTKNRADINSRSGGINDPKKKVSMPSPAPKKASKPSAAAKSANKLIKKQQQQQAQKQIQRQQTQKPVQQPKQQAPVQQTVTTPSPAKPAPPTARPSARPVSAPTPVAKPSSPFSVPAPKGAPTGKTLSTGPIGGTSAPTGSRSGGTSGAPTGNSGTGSYAPRPSLAPSSGGNGGQLSRGTSSGGGNVGNPGGGGGAPGIDALREPDFGPYMRELQNRIKMNWDPPKGNESKTVVLLFKIAKDGRLLATPRVTRSSGLQSADQAALKAVELAAPFRPLPADFKGQSIDIQFTFDYRVFGGRRY